VSWIRWPGFVVFVAIIAGLGAVVVLFGGPVVEWAVEAAGTRAVGAQVELADADLSLFPLGVTLSDLQVTDPDAPMTNAVQVDRIRCDVEPVPLLRRKVIIDAMEVTGVRVNTPRKVSGALPGRAAQPTAATDQRTGGGFALPGVDLPDPKTLLENEELASLAMAKQLQSDVQQTREEWLGRLTNLPDEKRLAEYRTRLDRLQAANKDPQAMLALREDLLALQRDLRSDIQGLEEAKGALQEDVATFRQRATDLRTAPRDDVARLKEKYALSSKGLSNVSRALFGGRIGGWVETALAWYQRLSPYLERAPIDASREAKEPKRQRGVGVDVRFPERHPSPDWLIRLADVSVIIPAGTVAGRIHNITPDQDLLGRPLTFDFASDALQGMEAIKLTGALDRVDPPHPHDTADLTMQGYRPAEVDLVQSDELHLALQEAKTDLDLRVDLRGATLAANATAALDAVRFATTTASQGTLAKSVAAALADVHRFQLQGELSGTVADPDLRITSDLDRVLKDAFAKQVKARAGEFEAQLTAGINERLAGPLAAVESQVGDLGLLDGDLQSRLKEGNLLTSEVEKRLKEAVAGKVKEKLGGSLKDSLKGKLPGF
jgi:uncharacterized protein (TIGR03545 family)